MALRTSAFLTTLALCATPASAHPPKAQPLAARIQEITVTHNYMLGRPGHFAFTRNGDTLLFLRAEAEDARSDLWAMDLRTNQERRLLVATDLLGGGEEKLSAHERAIRERKRIKTRGFTGYRLAKDGTTVVLQLSGDVFFYEVLTGRTCRLDFGEGGAIVDPRLSPDGRKLAFVRDHDLFVMALGEPQRVKGQDISTLGGKIRALTTDGEAEHGHGVAEFVAAEEMDRYRGYWWSPDSRAILYQTTDERHLERFTIADASRPEEAAQVFGYPRPGKANAKVDLHLVDVTSGARTAVRWDADALPYLARVTWPKGGPLAILVQARDQRQQQLRTVDLDTGRTQALLTERDDAWLNLSESAPRWSKDGEHLYWAAEAAPGWTLTRHTVRRSGGAWKVQASETVLDAQSGFRKIVHIDEARGRVWFLGGEDPVQTHLLCAPLGGGAPARISPEGGEHAAVFSGDGSRVALTRATFAEMPASAVHTLADEPAALTADAGVSITAVARAPSKKPNIERVPADRAGGFHAVIVRPEDFEAGRRYPVLLYVYGGPHHNMVSDNVSRYHLHQWMADHGFVVVSLDGRGTMHRGRDFERALLGKLGDVPLEDQVAGLTALAAHYPELNLDRVGVYGWSFGGYLAAMAAIRRPDVFRVAVAGAPVADWRYYDTHYTERYMGLLGEAEAAYTHSSLLTHAARLKRPLLLVHGIADDNVYFAHTLQLADALFRSRRDFTLLPLIGSTHQVADPSVRGALYDRVIRFLGAQLW